MIEQARAAVARETGIDAGALERRETHLSVVFLGERCAYKVERPVAFGFVDHRTLAARRRTQRAALRRNRALAADVYRRVLAVVPDAGGFRFAAEDDPAAVEYVLEMRRFDARDTLASRLSRGTLAGRDVERIAERLHAFHATARPVIAPARASPAAARTAAMVDVNLDELLGVLPSEHDRAEVHRVRRRLHAFLRDHAELIAARNRAGRVRELHGDLRADHVLIERDGVRVVDAVEFSRELAEVDVADELAFLESDLEARGARSVATRLIAAYREQGGDPGPAPLRAFFGVHRACVRSKVAALPWAGGPSDPLAESRRLLGLAARISWRIPGPRAYVVCGLSGSGKSHLAAALAGAGGFDVVASDVVRKQAAGLRPTDTAPARLYEHGVTEATYRDLGERAAAALESGDSLVVDATCLTRRHRAALIAGLGIHRDRAWFVWCEAPVDVLRRRIAHRLGRPDRVSDATVDVLERQRSVVEPLDEVPAERVLALRTDTDVERVIGRLTAHVDA